MSTSLVSTPSLDAVRDGSVLMQVGQHGDAVAHVQLLLGVFDDGKFGQNTKRAVVAFQQNQAVGVSPEDEGKVDAATLAALEAANEQVLASVARIDKRNKKIHLHPELRKKLAGLAEALAGRAMAALITDGFRSFAEQDALFAQGRTKPGKIVTKARGGLSNHNYGLAIDMYPVLEGQVFTDVPKGAKQHLAPRFEETQQAIIDAAEGQRLTSGAHFSGLVDTPHVQLLGENVLNPRESLKIFNDNNKSFDAVWTEATRLL
jgi:peptidoglycan hydrolase-like protein with peptidoglycan-binding domain